MREMRDEAKAEEQQIQVERARQEAHLEAVGVLQRRIQDLPTLEPASALEPQATVRNAIEVMRQEKVSCVLVVDQKQLVGVFTERDVVNKVAATPLDVDRVRLRDVMSPDPECLQMDDELVYALHQMHLCECRHIPVVDEQRRPIALVSMQAIISDLTASFPQEVLNLPPTPAHAIAPTREGA